MNKYRITPEQIKSHNEYNKAWYAKSKNRKAKNAYMREYYKKHKAEILEYKQMDRKYNPAKFAEYEIKRGRMKQKDNVIA